MNGEPRERGICGQHDGPHFNGRDCRDYQELRDHADRVQVEAAELRSALSWDEVQLRGTNRALTSDDVGIDRLIEDGGDRARAALRRGRS